MIKYIYIFKNGGFDGERYQSLNKNDSCCCKLNICK